MMIIGSDFHTGYQQIAMLDDQTGERTERRLEHESGEALKFYGDLPRPVRVGVEGNRSTALVRAAAGGVGARTLDRAASDRWEVRAWLPLRAGLPCGFCLPSSALHLRPRPSAFHRLPSNL